MEQIERRQIVEGLQIEDRGEGKEKGITGLGIVFNKRSVNLGGFVEIIKPEAVRDIDWTDVVSMVNHDSNRTVGRNPDTLSIKVEKNGVRYTIEPSELSYYRDLSISVSRGDIKGSSFGFMVETDGEDWTEDESGLVVRTITKFRKIYDISPVVFPAYPDTTAAKRSLDAYMDAKKPKNTYPIGLARRKFEVLKIKK